MKKFLFSIIVISVVLFVFSCNNAAELEKLKAQQQEEIDIQVATQLNTLRAELDSACNMQFDAMLTSRVDSLLAAAESAKAGTPKSGTKPKTTPKTTPTTTTDTKPKTIDEKMQDVRGNATKTNEPKKEVILTPKEVEERMKNVRGNATKKEDNK